MNLAGRMEKELRAKDWIGQEERVNGREVNLSDVVELLLFSHPSSLSGTSLLLNSSK